MSQIEAALQAGYTLTADIRDPSANYANLATGLTVTEVAQGVYRCNTGSLSGVVNILFKAGSIRFGYGYANLSAPAGNGYSWVYDDLPNALAVDKIQTGVVTVVSPVNEDGSLNAIVIGDDYLAIHGRQIDLYVDPIAGVIATDCACTFGGDAAHKGAWLVSGTVSAQNVDGLTKWRMRFELVEDDTRECKPGCYDWGATLIPPSKRNTKITGTVELIKSHTLN